MYAGLHIKHPLFLSDFKETFSQRIFEKITQISNFMKVRLVGAELFDRDGRTDTMKIIATSRNFANAPKNCYLCKLYVVNFCRRKRYSIFSSSTRFRVFVIRMDVSVLPFWNARHFVQK